MVAQKAESKYGSHITQFVGKDFYVDDGLISCATSEETIKVMKDTQEALMTDYFQRRELASGIQ
jgi:hypothetical protein